MSGLSADSAQRGAIDHFTGPALVLAPPGAGKTFVLTRRIAALISERQVPAEQILVITFTREAAREMEQRFLAMDCACRGVTFATFHSFYYHILKMSGIVHDPRILSENEKYGLLKSALDQMGYDKTVCDREDALGLLGLISYYQNTGKLTESVPAPFTSELIYRLCFMYQEEKRRRGAIDFDDMIYMVYMASNRDPDILEAYARRYRFVLVDEAQDMNDMQFEVIRKICYHNLFLVGDDDQSIYRFRGANPSLLLDFPKIYQGCSIYRLSTNYRCDSDITKASSYLIDNNKKRYKKDIKSFSRLKGRIYYTESPDEQSEAERCAGYIRWLMDNGANVSEIAVLFRNQSQASAISHALDSVGIGYVRTRKSTNERVSLFTFHGSKGLEFDHVIIIGACEGITPDRHAVHADEIEEERRMFYVAMTRARHSLVISVPVKFKNTPCRPSRFVMECAGRCRSKRNAANAAGR